MSENDVRITVYLDAVDTGVQDKLEGLQSQVESINSSMTVFGENMGNIQVPIGAVGKGIDSTAGRVRNALDPVRVASKDIWGLGYALRRLNVYVFGNNEEITKLVNTMIALGAALRIVAIINSVATSLGGMSGIIKMLTVAWQWFNVGLAQTAFWMGIITLGVAAVVGLAAWAATSAAMPKTPTGTAGGGAGGVEPSFATTGTVPRTGTYMLHKGEVYQEGNGPDYSQINVTVNSGPISSSMDLANVGKMLAVAVERERRRRGG